jgi:hypothetical protein
MTTGNGGWPLAPANSRSRTRGEELGGGKRAGAHVEDDDELVGVGEKLDAASLSKTFTVAGGELEKGATSLGSPSSN